MGAKCSKQRLRTDSINQTEYSISRNNREPETYTVYNKKENRICNRNEIPFTIIANSGVNQLKIGRSEKSYRV